MGQRRIKNVEEYIKESLVNIRDDRAVTSNLLPFTTAIVFPLYGSDAGDPKLNIILSKKSSPVALVTGGN